MFAHKSRKIFDELLKLSQQRDHIRIRSFGFVEDGKQEEPVERPPKAWKKTLTWAALRWKPIHKEIIIIIHSKSKEREFHEKNSP